MTQQTTQPSASAADASGVVVEDTAEETQLVPSLSAVRSEGESGLDTFLRQGGAASDAEVAAFLGNYLGGAVPSTQAKGFGCSALSVPSPEDHALFGRSFDWNACEASLSRREEALALLEQYDLHVSMGLMVHFALADAEGNSVAVEYIGNGMVVTETHVLTNFYLAEGERQGCGTDQPHTRCDILTDTLKESPAMTMKQMRGAVDSVSKDNFGKFASTEWTAVYDQSTGKVRYYHWENYQPAYVFQVRREKE